MLSFSTTLFLGQSAARVKNKSDEIVIGAFLPVSAVAAYAVARKLSELTLTVSRQFTRVLLPLAAELNARRDPAQLRLLYLDGSRMTLAIAVPIACGLVMLAQPVLTAWVGSAYGEYAYLLVILTVASLLEVSQWPAAAVLQGIGKYRVPALVAVGSAVANLVLSIVLIHPLGLGGVAIGTLLPTAVEQYCFVLPLTLRALGVSITDAVRDILWPVVLPLLPMALVVRALEQVADLSSLPWLLVAIAAGLLAYTATYVLVGARTDERQMLRDSVGTTLHQLRRRLRHS
jgi:O-antigen/teichoic acid export membrane protein